MCGYFYLLQKTNHMWKFKIFIIRQYPKKNKKKIARNKPKFKESYIETMKCNLEISCSFNKIWNRPKKKKKKCFPSSHMHSRKWKKVIFFFLSTPIVNYFVSKKKKELIIWSMFQSSKKINKINSGWSKRDNSCLCFC